jgi:hypothetical protein
MALHGGSAPAHVNAGKPLVQLFDEVPISSRSALKSVVMVDVATQWGGCVEALDIVWQHRDLLLCRDLALGVVGASDQRAGFDVPESEASTFGRDFVEFLGSVEAIER